MQHTYNKELNFIIITITIAITITIIKAWVAHSVQWLGYLLGERDSIPGRTGFFFSPPRPDRLWGPPNLLSYGYLGSILGGKEPWR
jgi:hypothetical protein